MSNFNWDNVASHLEVVIASMSASGKGKPCFGQEHAARAIVKRLRDGGTILADEVGLGKTRVALAIMDAVMRAGGAVAAVVPPGLVYQWEFESKEFSDSINSVAPDTCALKKAKKLRSYWGIYDDVDTYPLVNQKNGDWLLVSHNFGFLNRVQSNTELWKFELPILVRSLIALSNEEHGNSIWIKYLSNVFDERSNRSWKTKIEKEEKWNNQVKKAAEYLVKKYNSLSSHTQNFVNEMAPPIKRDGSPLDNAAEPFQQNGYGRKPLHELIGHILGKVDLLIIDEAHKSREEQSEDSDSNGRVMKRLSTLLEEIIQPRNSTSRRLCLTATPVELGASQWKDLLQRAKINEVEKDCLVKFEECLKKANMAPDDPQAIDQLEITAKDFEASLRPVMVRRRRINQKEHKDLLISEETAHPHRFMNTLSVDINDLNEPWKKAVLALEGMSLAAAGTKVNNGAKIVRYRYASGMLDLSAGTAEQDMVANNIPGPKLSKENRVRFWHKLALSHVINHDGRWDSTSHPRVQKTADFIEATLREYPDEKFLVFGTFTKPMQGLVKELNARYVIRQLVSGKPTLSMRVSDDALWNTYQRLDNRNDMLGFSDTHLRFKNKEDLINKLKEAEKEYLNLQERLARWFDEDELLKKLPGDSCLKSMKDDESSGKNLKSVLHQLRADLLEELLEGTSNRRNIFSFNENDTELDDDSRNNLTKRIIEIWSDYIQGAYDQNLSSDIQKSTEWDGDKEFREVDALGDHITPYHLLSAMEIDTTERTTVQRGGFCRLMDGSMAMSTRRIVQERFNRKGAMPKVLVAQSLVGREGLNLHRACRRVVLFHPEWNPAIVEQEIGRVDRIRSLWNEMAIEWKNNDKNPETYPKIECTFVVFKGTYDEWQFRTLESRRRSLEAQLFGALLDEEALARLGEGERLKIAKAAPDFDPVNTIRK
ncbi:MAG: helicase-related protein [Thermodesulfobacteriota bacterium]